MSLPRLVTESVSSRSHTGRAPSGRRDFSRQDDRADGPSLDRQAKGRAAAEDFRATEKSRTGCRKLAVLHGKR